MWALLPLLLVSVWACVGGGGELAAGTYAMEVTADDQPPSPRLVGVYLLEVADDHAYELTGPDFVARGRLEVVEDRVRLVEDDRCAPDDVGIYTWRAEGTSLRFSVVEDACDAEVGGRAFVLSVHPWERAETG